MVGPLKSLQLYIFWNSSTMFIDCWTSAHFSICLSDILPLYPWWQGMVSSLLYGADYDAVAQGTASKKDRLIHLCCISNPFCPSISSVACWLHACTLLLHMETSHQKLWRTLALPATVLGGGQHWASEVCYDTQSCTDLLPITIICFQMFLHLVLICTNYISNVLFPRHNKCHSFNIWYVHYVVLWI